MIIILTTNQLSQRPKNCLYDIYFNFRMCILIVLIPIIQVILHCVYYGKYPRLLPIAVYNQEADCVYNLSESIENYNYSCNLLHYTKMNKIKPVSISV